MVEAQDREPRDLDLLPILSKTLTTVGEITVDLTPSHSAAQSMHYMQHMQEL